MSHNLNLDSHVILPQPRDTHTSPQRLVVGHPLAHVAHHSRQGLVVDGYVVRVDAEDLRPALASRVLEAALDILEGQVDLLVDLPLELARLGVPSACGRSSVSICVTEGEMSDRGLENLAIFP